MTRLALMAPQYLAGTPSFELTIYTHIYTGCTTGLIWTTYWSRPKV